MKVLFIFDKVLHYHEPLFSQLESILARHRHTLYLLSGEPRRAQAGRVGVPHRLVTNEIKYQTLEYRVFSYMIRLQKGVIAQIQAIRPDAVVVPSHVGNITTWRIINLKKRQKFRLYAWQCGYEYHQNPLKKRLLRYFLGQFDRHLAYHTNAKTYVTDHGIDPDRVTVIFNTIDENRIEHLGREEARGRLLADHPELKDKTIALFVGALLREKRVDVLCQAFDALKRDDAALLIVGDGPCLKSLRRQYRGNPNIVFAGRVVQGVGAYFSGADIFVLPGTGGLAINEAMAHGLPVISSYADGSADDLVGHGENGYRLKDGSPREIAAYLDVLLDNGDLRSQFGRESLRRIKNDYSFDRFVRRISELLLGNPPEASCAQGGKALGDGPISEPGPE